MARALFQAAEKRIGVPIVIENHAGASGAIGYYRLARSKPDGYTLGCSNTGQLVMELTQKTPFKTKEDFTPIAQIVRDPYGIYVKSDSPFKTLNDLLEYAKANPDKTISWGGRGKWDEHYATMAKLMTQTGVKFNMSPLTGPARSKCCFVGGHVF
jgi:tripartite-type tricarboxylate transporter receptor subunit TctC